MRSLRPPRRVAPMSHRQFKCRAVGIGDLTKSAHVLDFHDGWQEKNNYSGNCPGGRGSCRGHGGLDCCAAFDGSGVAICVGFGTQADRGIYWAFAVGRIRPQGVGQIRLDHLRLELREAKRRHPAINWTHRRVTFLRYGGHRIGRLGAPPVRGDVPEGGTEPPAVGVAFDGGEQVMPGGIARGIADQANEFGFPGSKGALHGGVVVSNFPSGAWLGRDRIR